ncbi:glycosyltransferase family 9 protein [Candidatus Woesearchaeota archaeon]|nr:glycosyltransferase family 9 protein [Candidatus Woesearchaeota archaeon]
MRILIIKLAAIGDVLRTTSIVKGLKNKYPESEILWVTAKESYDILKNNEYIDRIIILDKEAKNKLEEEFELVISLDDDFEAIKLASSIKKKKLMGAYTEGNEIKYTDSSAAWFDMGLSSKFGKKRADELKKENKKTYQQIISEIVGVKESEPILTLEEREIGFAKDFAERKSINENDLVIGLNTSAGKRWQLKKWDIKKTAELANKLIEELNAKVILFGGPEERERNDKIKKLANGIIGAGCDNSLLEFASLINLCSILVTSDSLAMHIGIALKKKVIALFGPTSSSEIELFGRGKKIISNLECVCCYKKTCDKKPNCMDMIIAEQVFNAVKELI